MVTVAQMKRKSIDNDVIRAKQKLHVHFGDGIKSIRFGKIRMDGTRNVVFLYRVAGVWHKGSYSYLTDIQ